MAIVPLGWTANSYGGDNKVMRRRTHDFASGRPRKEAAPRRGRLVSGRERPRAREMVLAMGWTSGAYGRPQGRRR